MNARVIHPPPDHLQADAVPEPSTTNPFARPTGAALIAACAAFVAGATALTISGVDLDGAVQSGSVPAVLPAMADAVPALTVAFVAWMVGATLFAIAATGMARLHDDDPTAAAAAGLTTLGAALAIPAFLAMLALVHVVAASPAPSPELATALGWLATTTDWVATIAILGVPPLLLTRAGHGSWAPGWLVGLATAAAVAAVVTAVSLLTGTGLTTWGFALVPIGMAAHVSTGVLLWQRG